MSKKDAEDIIDENQIETNPDYLKKKYFYRTLIAKGCLKVKNLEKTKRLIGPDAAYHLYSCKKS